MTLRLSSSSQKWLGCFVCRFWLIDWLEVSLLDFLSFLDGFYDPSASRPITIQLFVYSLYQVSNFLLHLIHLSVTTSSLLHFQLNEWKSLICSLISSVSFLFPSIDYIAWFIDWSIYVFGLFDSGKKLLFVSFIMLWIWLMFVCSELWKISLKCFMWKIHFAFYEKKNIILVYLSKNIALVALLRS